MVHLEVLQAEPFPILAGITGNVTPGWTPSLATAPWGPHPGRGPPAGRQAAPSSGLIRLAGLNGEGKPHSDACREEQT